MTMDYAAKVEHEGERVAEPGEWPLPPVPASAYPPAAVPLREHEGEAQVDYVLLHAECCNWQEVAERLAEALAVAAKRYDTQFRSWVCTGCDQQRPSRPHSPDCCVVEALAAWRDAYCEAEHG